MKRLRYIFALSALLMSFAAANAALITVDSPLGPATAVLDTDAGLEWLKLSTTRSMSVNQVFAQMKPGGNLEGFHHGTSEEFGCSLLYPHVGFGCQSIGSSKDSAQVQSFLDVFGLDFNETSLYAVQPPDISREHGWTEGYAEAFAAVFYLYPDSLFPVEYDRQLIGVPADRPQPQWIVREAQALPEPSTLLLLGMGVIAMTALRKRGMAKALM